MPEPVIGEHISDIIVDTMVAELEAVLKTAVDPEHPSYVSFVQGGKLQANPVTKGNSITVHIGDPEETSDDWVDEIALPSDPYVDVQTVAEIGGNWNGLFWWRRGVVLIECFFLMSDVRYDRPKSRQVANDIRRSVETVIGSTDSGFMGLSDGYERCLLVMPSKSRAREAGGPNQHIWHVKVWWQALTTRI